MTPSAVCACRRYRDGANARSEEDSAGFLRAADSSYVLNEVTLVQSYKLLQVAAETVG